MLLVLHAVLLVFPPVYKYFVPPKLPAAETDSIWTAFQQAASMSTDASLAYHQSSEEAPSFKQGKRFYFDPNTLSATGWKTLGVSAGTVSTIQKYLSKGGRFYQASDLEKIYGLSPNLATQLMPFVRIQEFSSSNRLTFSKSSAPFKKYVSMVDVNEADSVAWETLPGIGPALSARIVKFRNQLGGFLDIQQIKEVYGLSDSVFESLQHRLVKGNASIQRLHLNTIDQATLQKHPYIRYSMAKAIVRYREQHGPFARVEDIKKAFFIQDSEFQKLQPYLTTE